MDFFAAEMIFRIHQTPKSRNFLVANRIAIEITEQAVDHVRVVDDHLTAIANKGPNTVIGVWNKAYGSFPHR